jgi:hypothetical protein
LTRLWASALAQAGRAHEEDQQIKIHLTEVSTVGGIAYVATRSQYWAIQTSTGGSPVFRTLPDDVRVSDDVLAAQADCHRQACAYDMTAYGDVALLVSG